MTNKRLPGDTYHDAYRDYLRAVLNKAEKNRTLQPEREENHKQTSSHCHQAISTKWEPLNPTPLLAIKDADIGSRTSQKEWLEAIKENRPCFEDLYYTLKGLSDTLKNDRDFMLEAVKIDSLALEFIGDNLKSDKDFWLKAMQIDDYNLTNAPEEFKADPDVVLAALEKNTYPLQFAHESIRKNPRFIACIINKPCIDEYIDESIREAVSQLVWADSMSEYKLKTTDQGQCFGLSSIMAYMDSVGKTAWWCDMLKIVVNDGNRHGTKSINQDNVIDSINRYLEYIQQGETNEKLKSLYNQPITMSDMPDYTDSLVTSNGETLNYTLGRVMERVTALVRQYQGDFVSYDNTIINNLSADNSIDKLENDKTKTEQSHAIHYRSPHQDEVLETIYSRDADMNHLCSFLGYMSNTDIKNFLNQMTQQQNKGIGIRISYPTVHACSMRIDSDAEKSFTPSMTLTRTNSSQHKIKIHLFSIC